MKNRSLLIGALAAALAIGAWFFYNKPSNGSPETVSSSPSPVAVADRQSPTPERPTQAVQAPASSDAFTDALLTGPATTVEPADTPSPASATVLGHPATERVYLRANDQVRIPLNRAALLADSPIILRADNGGVIDGQALSPQVELPTDAASFIFHVGAHRGLYSVTVSQGSRTETLEFWVGEPTPVGQPGPVRTITPPAALSAES